MSSGQQGGTAGQAVSIRDRAARWWVDPARRPVSTGFEARHTGWFAHVVVSLARGHVDDPVDRVVDLGCGPGRSLAVARTRFPAASLVGIDPDGASLAEAARHPALAGSGTTLLRGRAEESGHLLDDVAPGPYDVATVLLNIALWQDRTSPLAAVLERLRHNGVVVVLDLVAPHDDDARRTWLDLAADEDEQSYLRDQMAAWPDDTAYREIADELAEHPRAADTRLAICGLFEVGAGLPSWQPGARPDTHDGLPPGPRAALLLVRAGSPTEAAR